MNNLTPLQRGDTIRIIAPSLSMSTIPHTVQKRAEKHLKAMGFLVTYGKYVYDSGPLGSASIEQRLEDLMEAWKDPEVKMIITAIGGYNINSLLPLIDFHIIKNNPKFFCGYSDITVLANAIYAKTALPTYSGPNFWNLGMRKGCDYTLNNFQSCVSSGKSYSIYPSKQWSDDNGMINGSIRTFIDNEGPRYIQEGKASGVCVGGNLCSLNLLQGTEYMPSLHDKILFLEEDDLCQKETYKEFDRNLESLLQLPDAKGLRALLIGRFQRTSGMTKERLDYIIKSKTILNSIPVVADLDFGHTSPKAMIPIGGEVELMEDSSGQIIIHVKPQNPL